MDDSQEGFLQDEESLGSLISGFEAGTWPAANWRHAHHVALAACYILDGDGALDRLRHNIPIYNVRQGGKNTPESGYHETLTVFWYELVRTHLVQLPANLTRLETVRRAVEAFGKRRDIFREYYDFDVVNSREARATWIPPGRPIDGSAS